MYPMLEEELARQTQIEARRTAAAHRRARVAKRAGESARVDAATAGDIVIRTADAGDILALMHLSELDSRDLPAGQMLVAEVNGRIRAALAVEAGITVADPFVSTDHLVALLQLRAQQVDSTFAGGRRRGVLGLLSMRPGRAA